MSSNFNKKCLFKVRSTPNENMSQGLESVWAYIINYPGSSHPTPGRYRIRVSRINGFDNLMSIGQIEVAEESLSEIEGFSSIQGYVDQWSSGGWIHVLDWIGDDKALDDVESDLNEMFQSFITAEPIGEFSYIPAPTPKSPAKKRGKPPASNKKDSDDKEDSDDFDWI